MAASKSFSKARALRLMVAVSLKGAQRIFLICRRAVEHASHHRPSRVSNPHLW
jgi:hypothetical protein